MAYESEEDDYDGPWIEKRIEWKCPERRRYNVVLFGSWNGFKGGHELEYEGKQIFACHVKLPLGKYVYRFLINQEDWATHFAEPQTTINGIRYNVIMVSEDSDEEEEDDTLRTVDNFNWDGLLKEEKESTDNAENKGENMSNEEEKYVYVTL